MEVLQGYPGNQMPEIDEYVGPSGKHKKIYPVHGKFETIALRLSPGEAAKLGAAMLNASGKCGRGQGVHLTAFRKSKKWTVNIVKE